LQDAYLFAWFIMLANVLTGRGDLRSLRIAWVLAACTVSIVGLIGVATHGGDSVAAVLNPKGFRAMGTFDQPDELADYLAMSVFMALSLTGRTSRLLRWFAIALMLAAMAATKANGGVLSLAAGLIAWSVVRVWALGVSPAGWIAGGLIAVSAVLLVVWIVAGLGVGSAQLSRLEANSFLGRMGHSSEGRERIWASLGRRYQAHPLGIGPGNSRWQTVTIEERERPTAGHLDTYDSGADPFLSKEAHNDYLAYMIERGPLALIGMLILRWQAFMRILRSGRGMHSAGDRAASGALTAALFGAWVASCLNANTIETLHFRHVWLFLAMVCALETLPRHGRGARHAARPEIGLAGVAS
ncbi:MAG: O-antigen ligase family protein, partial [Candidatus Eiseniibacteriota bacterium]